MTNIFLQLKYIQLRSTKVQLLCFVGRLLKTITKRASVFLCVCVCVYVLQLRVLLVCVYECNYIESSVDPEGSS